MLNNKLVGCCAEVNIFKFFFVLSSNHSPSLVVTNIKSHIFHTYLQILNNNQVRGQSHHSRAQEMPRSGSDISFRFAHVRDLTRRAARPCRQLCHSSSMRRPDRSGKYHLLTEYRTEITVDCCCYVSFSE